MIWRHPHGLCSVHWRKVNHRMTITWKMVCKRGRNNIIGQFSYKGTTQDEGTGPLCAAPKYTLLILQQQSEEIQRHKVFRHGLEQSSHTCWCIQSKQQKHLHSVIQWNWEHVPWPTQIIGILMYQLPQRFLLFSNYGVCSPNWYAVTSLLCCTDCISVPGTPDLWYFEVWISN